MVKKAFLKTFLDLETAETEGQRAKGLQDRKELDEYKGMLFNYENSEPRKFWMKNTHIPLDIVFLSEKGKVLNIEQGSPRSKKRLRSDGDCKHVLELNQGKADDFNISQGDDLSFLL